MTQMGLTISSGTFPDGSQSWAVDTLRDTWVLPDWSIVDSPGALYTRWGPGGRAGDSMTPSVRAGASIGDSRTYASGSEVSVRIWRTWNEYRDITELLDADSGMPVVKKAENLPGSISLAVGMDWETPSANPLSSSFGGWSRLVSGIGTVDAGAVRTGMYLTVHVKEGSQWVIKAEGWISTLSPDAGRLRIECADGLAVLARQGATLRRNYYEARIRARGDASFTGGSLYGSLDALPQGAFVDPNSYQWLVIKRWPGSSRISGSSSEKGVIALSTSDPWMPYVVLSYKSPVACRLEHVTTHVANQELATGADCKIVAEVAGIPYESSEEYLGVFTTYELEFEWTPETAPVVAEGQEITLTWYAKAAAWSADQHSTMHLHFWFGDNEGAEIPCECTARGDSTYQLNGQVPDWAIYAFEYRKATGEVSGDKVLITSIKGEDASDEDLADPPTDRFEFAYFTSEESRDEIMRKLVMSHDALPFIAGATDASLGIYRIGGGYMSDYVTKIADVVGDDGQRRTVTARGFMVMAIASGVRHARTDAAALTVCRNASASGVPSGAVEFVSFSPRMTLKGKPSLAVVRGTWEGDEAIPMVVAMEAEGVSEDRGLVLETVVTDSEAADVRSAMRAAWASLDAESLDVWEGTLVIPGFHPELIERCGAHAGAGAVVAVYDERYGLSGYKVLVKEVRADWRAWTTELVVTSHSPVYASVVPDTAAEVQSAGDLSTGSGLLYTVQYARIVTQASVGTLPPKVEVSTDSGAWWECDDVSVGTTPTRAVITARIRAGRGRCTDYDGPYAVSRVRLNEDVVLGIDPYRTPDLYEGQVLIVQVDCPRPGPTTTYTAYFHVATGSIGYGSVSVASVANVPAGTAVTVAQTVAVGAVGSCSAAPQTDTAQWDYSFVMWTGADDASTPAPTAVDADVHYYAHFSRATQAYGVGFHVATDSAGYGTVSPASLSGVAYGTSVTVAQTLVVGSAGQCAATPAASTAQYAYAFLGWTGADDASTPAPTTIAGATSYYAHFSRTPLPMDPALFTYLTSGGNVYVKGWAGTPPADGYDLYLPSTDDQGDPLYGVNGNNGSGYVSPFSGASTLNAPSVKQVATRAFQGCALLTSVSLPSAINVYSAAFKGCTAIEEVTFGPLANLGSSDSFPDWTFYAADGTTVLSKTAANLKNSTFVGTASRLVKQP